MLVSAVGLAKDEADTLPGCVGTLSRFVDEIVLFVDAATTPETREMASRFEKVRLVDGVWPDSFSEARNIAAAAARGEWLLRIDADEVFAGDPDRYRRRLEVDAVDLLKISWADTDGQQFWSHRLFRNGRFEWRGCVHEILWPADHDHPVSTDGWRLIPAAVFNARIVRPKRIADRQQRYLDMAARHAAAGSGQAFPGYCELMAAVSAAWLAANGGDIEPAAPGVQCAAETLGRTEPRRWLTEAETAMRAPFDWPPIVWAQKRWLHHTAVAQVMAAETAALVRRRVQV
jgi:hypothetical protein